MGLPFLPYPRPSKGYWYPVTSTLNWCEEDYYATDYAAEIVNTITNLLFMFLAVKGARNCIKEGHDGIFLVAFVGYFLVGLGSFLFHASLKYPMQLVDELSMIYTTCLMVYATFSHSRSRRFAILLAAALVALAVFITLYYHYLQDPVFHQNAYALLTTVVVVRSVYLMESTLRTSTPDQAQPSHDYSTRSSGQSNGRKIRHPQAERDMKILRTMWYMVACGLTLFLGGFGIWTLDNKYCSTLRKWRHQIGLPWGIFLEGHGWWHILTGVGAYYYIVWGSWLRHCLNGRQDEFKLLWPSTFSSLPQLVRKETEDGALRNGAYENGSAKKRR